MKKLQVFLMFAFIFAAFSVNYLNKNKIIVRKDKLISANNALIEKKQQDANPVTSFATVKSNGYNTSPTRPNPCDIFDGDTDPNKRCDCEGWSGKDPAYPNFGMQAFVEFDKMLKNKMDLLDKYMLRLQRMYTIDWLDSQYETAVDPQRYNADSPADNLVALKAEQKTYDMQQANSIQGTGSSTDFKQVRNDQTDDSKKKQLNFQGAPDNNILSQWQQVIHKALFSTGRPNVGPDPNDAKGAIHKDIDNTIHMMFNTEYCVWQRYVYSHFKQDTDPELNCPHSMQSLGSGNFDFNAATDADRVAEYQKIMMHKN